MFSYHHVTYFCSNLSLDIQLPQKSSDRSDVLCADFENSKSWLWDTEIRSENFLCMWNAIVYGGGRFEILIFKKHHNFNVFSD